MASTLDPTCSRPLGLLLLAALLMATQPSLRAATMPRQGADLLKTDILGVFAHPDDETGMAASLARYGRGEGRVIAHAYVTRGEGGGNMVGTQGGPALGILREAELRECLDLLGVRFCHFLEQEDFFYTESHAATLRKWDRPEALRRLVRLVRALRPEVILTMNPAPNPGQHGHHQAAGVLATEAFYAAADPTVFPEQLQQEGLSVWQARKLFFGGASGGFVTTLITTEPLIGGRSPASLAGEALSHHRSQGFGGFANAPWLARPQAFTLVKSVVRPRPTSTDVFEDLPVSGPAQVVSFAQDPPPILMSFRPRPAIRNYLRWASAQGIAHLTADFPADLPVVAGEPASLHLDIDPAHAQPLASTVGVRVDAGWPVSLLKARDPDKPSLPLEFRVEIPAEARVDVEVEARADLPGGAVLARARLHPVPHTRVRKAATPPSLEASHPGWLQATRLSIGHDQAWQGKATSPADCSAEVRLLKDDRGLWIAVEVRDDTVVSNIRPDDIRGHWRSDSIEICLDPAAGAEDTTGCFKLGVFPFDTSGRVRAARDADARQGPVETTAPGVRLHSERSAEGYRVAAFIPWDSVVVEGPPPRRLGFNLLVYDGDKADAAPGENINRTRLAWSPRPGVQGRPEDWGRIDLE